MDHRELQQINAHMGGSREQNDEQRQQKEMVNSVLSQILTPDARERLMRIEMVRPDRAKQAEASLVQLARSGKLRSKIDENQLVDLLGRLGTQNQKVVFQRKRDDSDDEFDQQEQARSSQQQQQQQQHQEDDDDDDFFD